MHLAAPSLHYIIVYITTLKVLVYLLVKVVWLTAGLLLDSQVDLISKFNDIKLEIRNLIKEDLPTLHIDNVGELGIKGKKY